MTILITGASGMVGRHLVALLLQRGHAIRFLTTSARKTSSIAGASGFVWDPSRGTLDPDALSGVECVVHLAGATIGKRWTGSYKREIISSRVQSAQVLYRALETSIHRVSHFISASGIGIYPDSLTEHYDEKFTGAPNGFAGEVVRQWEQQADAFQKLGIGVAKVRTGLVLSKAGGALEKLVQPIKLGFGAPLGSGNQIVSWIHIDDLVGIYVKVIEEKLDGIYNAVAPGPVSQRVLTRQIASVLQKPLWLPKVPRAILRMMLGEMSALLTEGQFVSSEKIIRSGYRFKFPEAGPALKDLLTKIPIGKP